jgi:hypothetical protein
MRLQRYYILDEEHHAIEVPDFDSWAEWFENSNRQVDYTEITSQMYVSTVCIGLDHSLGVGPPLLFETMIFGGPKSVDRQQWRYASWDDAVVGHKAAVRIARASSYHD